MDARAAVRHVHFRSHACLGGAGISCEGRAVGKGSEGGIIRYRPHWGAVNIVILYREGSLSLPLLAVRGGEALGGRGRREGREKGRG